MGNALQTNTLPLLLNLVGWMELLLSDPSSYTVTLYLGGFSTTSFCNRQSMLISFHVAGIRNAQGLDLCHRAALDHRRRRTIHLSVRRLCPRVRYGYFQAKDF
jgi:hypothetical protein